MSSYDPLLVNTCILNVHIERLSLQAARLAFKFLPQKSTKVVQYIAPKLIEIKKYTTVSTFWILHSLEMFSD